MSHILKIKAAMTDIETIQKVADKLHANVLGPGTHQFFGSSSVKGFGVKLQGWQFPLVIDEEGSLKYDAYGSSVGDKGLQDFVQGYAVEKTCAELSAQGIGYYCQDTVNENGILTTVVELV